MDTAASGLRQREPPQDKPTTAPAQPRKLAETPQNGRPSARPSREESADPMPAEMVFALVFLLFIVGVALMLYFTGAVSDVGGSQRRMEDTEVRISIDLETAYMGGAVKVAFPGERQRICRQCDGTGGMGRDGVEVCPSCQGAGAVLQNQRIAPGFVQQFRMQCHQCGGSGKFIRKRCPQCHGRGVERKREEFPVEIPKGIPEEHVLLIEGAGHEMAGVATGNVHVQVTTSRHRRFQRAGEDLHHELSVSLKEALLGFTKEIEHLDGHKVVVERVGVTAPGTILTIEGEGMPNFEGWGRGRLLVLIDVQFPKRFSNDEKSELRQLLKH